MANYIGKRLLHLVGILIALSFLTFLLMYLAPGDAATKKLNAQGIAVSQEVLERTRKEMGLDRPFLVQYGDWALGALRGDLGSSDRAWRPKCASRWAIPRFWRWAPWRSPF